MKALTKLSMTAALCGVGLLTTVNTQAANLFLRADTTSVTMPDGRSVPMWGFALDTAPFAANGAVTVPGPTIPMPAGDTTLRILLDNNLPEGVSITIPGLGNPEVRVGNPINGTLLEHTRFTDAAGRERARSLVAETPPGNVINGLPNQFVWYVWNNVKPGTYLYHSGSHVGLQVQMGLYGALTKLAAGGAPYNGISASTEQTFLFSEVDADLHDAVYAGDYGPAGSIKSTLNSDPQYFLINGKAYSPGQPLIPVTDAASAAPALLRFLNAGQDTRVPILDGSELTLIAEDGNPYTYTKTSYSVLLPALKTMDALWTPSAAGTFALYDRRLGLYNNMQPGTGGMLVHLGASQTFVGAPAISIPSGGNASPYPSSINVAGLAGAVNRLTVTLNGFSHARPQDVDVLLVGPGGQKVVLMSDVGGNIAISAASPVTLTLDDSAPGSLGTGQLRTGTYKPSNRGARDPFPTAPAGPVSTTLSAFNGSDPNGAWRLYVRDDASSRSGAFAGGWSISITPVQ